MKQYLDALQRWLGSLQPRERHIVVSGSISLLLILFYLLIWEPVFTRLEDTRQAVESQRQTLSWMKSSGQQIRSLQASGAAISPQLANQSASSLVTLSAQSNGVQEFITKLDSTKDGVEVQLTSADFDRVMTWLNDLQNRYGLQPRKIIIEPQTDPGSVNARVTLEKSS